MKKKMLCKKCMTAMESGTIYEKDKVGKTSARRFHECKKCHDKVYTKEYNSQECMSKSSKNCGNR